MNRPHTLALALDRPGGTFPSPPRPGRPGRASPPPREDRASPSPRSASFALALALATSGCIGTIPSADTDAATAGSDLGTRPPPPGTDAGSTLPGTDAAPPLPPGWCTADIPPEAPPAPVIDVCNYMDWHLSSDGWYYVSRFGTTNDSTTLGHTTSCGWLQAHYGGAGCIYDLESDTCLPGDHTIPWVQGHVDYDFDTVLDTVDLYAPGDVPAPEYFYVAGGQRFNCGSTLRVTNPANGRCVVAYAEDGGPGATYEDVGYGERRILDSSPAVVRFLDLQHWGWANSDIVYVEWGLPGDVPGSSCTPCESTAAAEGSLGTGTPFDVDHMMNPGCRD